MRMLQTVMIISILFWAAVAVVMPGPAECDGPCSSDDCTLAGGCGGPCGCVIAPGQEWGRCYPYEVR